MSIQRRLTDGTVSHHRVVALVVAAVTVTLAAAAGLPSLFPQTFGFLPALRVDTDPENMLPADDPVRVRHDRMKERFGLHDMVVVGVVNPEHPEGVFNPASLRRIKELTDFALTLNSAEIGAEPGQGVIEADVIAPSTVDRVDHAEGTIGFSYLMHEPPETQSQAEAIRDAALRVPFLRDTVVSRDGRAIAIYLPLSRKDLSHRVYTKLNEKIATFDGPERFHITGLPVAEDTFGVEMFIQMAISAPTAMAVIFVLMLVFFRKLILVVSPMLVALVSVVVTMGALIVSGFPVHIMSSMIPIFIMPIAVLDSIHILSEFFDRYQETRDRRETLRRVMESLFWPMLYTSLTSAAGFASLALTPIPPVQIFGVYVAAGILVAWLLTVTFIPAFVMFIPARMLETFGAKHDGGDEAPEATGPLARFLRAMGSATYRRAKPILAVAAVVLVVAGYGITQIRVNDNPVKWFTPSHPIRVADRVLNDHFGGTYMAYLALEAPRRQYDAGSAAQELSDRLREQAAGELPDTPEAAAALDEAAELLRQQAPGAASRDELASAVDDAMRKRADEAAPDDIFARPSPRAKALNAVSRITGRLREQVRQEGIVFKDPDVLRYMRDLQEHMRTVTLADSDQPVVGKSNSLADIVMTVRRAYISGKDKDFRVPATRGETAKMLDQYQSSHRKDDLWHFVTEDYRTASVWVQLTSGDNKDMSRVATAVDEYVADNPPPEGLEHKWFGLTYINVVWQEKMVRGMLGAFLGSFVVVFLLMTILFRSALWGLLSMLPLTVTIAAIYGAVGLVGKDYDMPVAVLSSLTLGLAVDFAIHFLARGRAMFAEIGSWKDTAPKVFGEPARAISRNIIVIAAGFLPLLLAPLVPYKTVGALLATILLVSGAATLLILPALIRVLARPLFPATRGTRIACNCGTCIAVGAALAGVAIINIRTYREVGWNVMMLTATGIIAAMALGCCLSSRFGACKRGSVPASEDAAKMRGEETTNGTDNAN
ncbi:MAG: MMPL family transporter [Phycisphaerae bacterium]|nr:MMPL family transporter [Phycisphaerae bacterium]